LCYSFSAFTRSLIFRKKTRLSLSSVDQDLKIGLKTKTRLNSQDLTSLLLVLLMFCLEFVSDAYSSVFFCVQVRGGKSRALHDRVLVNCQYSMAVFSTAERKRRPRGDRRSVEMTRFLERTFAAAILTHLYPRSQIDIFVEVHVFTYVYSYS
jgi:3' exoribonuclease family, domain 1